MFHTPDYYHNVSMRLSAVLDDIAVNENMVLKTRKSVLLQETIQRIANRAAGTGTTAYRLGSMSEGTTTIGLKSDADILLCIDVYNVIQDWGEWTPGKLNLLMIQNEATPPGYCLLQVLRNDVPLPVRDGNGNRYVKDKDGRVLFKNTVIDVMFTSEGSYRQGPSFALPPLYGFVDFDRVPALPCKSWPQSSRAWLDQPETNTWPTSEMKRYAKTTRCVVVGVGSNVSENADFEWRISTSLAERCLMFNLNITQIRCYILMKMILKTYINLEDESYISSYMCKTVLFYCIANKPSNIWKECSILICLGYCLFTLNMCILKGNCPHFSEHDNNLMAGKISTEVKHQLLERMSNLIPLDGHSLSGIQIDDLGERLQIKLNMINEVHHDLLLPVKYTMIITSALLEDTARQISLYQNIIIHRAKDESLDMKLKTLTGLVQQMTRYYRDGDMLEKAASKLLAPLYSTSIGSLIASHNIQINNTVSPQAFACLEAGQNSDVASSRLKLASIMYRVGNIEIAASILSNIEKQYKRAGTLPICACYEVHNHYITAEFGCFSNKYDEGAVKHVVALCVSFFPFEINCVPKELQYEIFRSTQEELLHRGPEDYLIDSAAVHSLPYLHFLQYKIYGNLQRPEKQQQALNKLSQVTEFQKNLAHRETALNLLGQCMEQENRHADALKCYMLSLRHRERNNAARIHICKFLANRIRRLPY